MGGKRLTAEAINERLSIRGISVKSYSGHSKRHSIFQCQEGHQWSAKANSVLNGHGCPECYAASKCKSEVLWPEGITCAAYSGKISTKSRFRCDVGHEWLAVGSDVARGRHICPVCSTVNRHLKHDDIVNRLSVRGFLLREYGGCVSRSLSTLECAEGHIWESTLGNIFAGRGCPSCAESGYDRSRRGTLYALRSECGSNVKIGISNDYKARHATLKRATPFDWSCIFIAHGNGVAVAESEKELHSLTEQALFDAQFDGYTEWRKWDDRIPGWLDLCRRRIEAP